MPLKPPLANQLSAHVTDLDRIIRLKEFLLLTGLGRSTVYKMISVGVIDRPLQISVRAVGWRMSSVTKFLNSRRTTGVKS
jgi:prophage regulatory protein